MDLLDFRAGDPLRLDIYDESGKNVDREFTSRFEEALDGYEAYINAPVADGVTYAVRAGWEITVYMRDGNAFCRFRARVMQRLQRGEKSLLRIRREGGVEMARRRRYYRFRCAIPFKYRVIADIRKDLETPFSDGETADISGSGLSFTTDVELGVNNFIECELSIDGEPVYLVGKITRCDRIAENDYEKFAYHAGVFFSEIESRKREMIIGFILNEERRQLKVGIG